MYYIDKGHCFFGCDVTELCQGFIFRRCYMWKLSSGSSESIKSTFTVSRYLNKPPLVFNILFQRGTYDMTSGEALKNEHKFAITSEYLYKQPSSNENIS